MKIMSLSGLSLGFPDPFDYYKSIFPYMLKTPSRYVNVNCPFCDHTLHLNLKTGCYMCNMCLDRGDMLSFHMRLHKVDAHEAKRQLEQLKNVVE